MIHVAEPLSENPPMRRGIVVNRCKPVFAVMLNAYLRRVAVGIIGRMHRVFCATVRQIFLL
jgi:hypothetical protein